MFHPALGNVRYSLQEVSEDPEQQVEQVIGIMSRYAVEDSRSSPVQQDLRTATAALGMYGFPGGHPSPEEKAAAIFSHVKNRMSFVQDERTSAPLQDLTPTPIAEALIRPADMAGGGAGVNGNQIGDCDDYAMYTASLLLAAGIPCAFVTVAADPMDPARFSHVYVAAYPPSGRLALDTSHGEYPGWEAVSVYQRREWPLVPILAGGLLAWVAALGIGWWLCSQWKVRTV